MTTKTNSNKIATCTNQVPACLSPTGVAINAGEKIEYIKTKFRNGEGHLILANGKSVPDVFFKI